MSSRRFAPLAAALLALALLASPALAGHHEAGEAKGAADAAEAAPKGLSAEDLARLTDVRAAKKTAPDQFRVEFDTTKGKIVLEVNRDWSPQGADRFYSLVEAGYYEDIAFFRVIEGFMAQFGMHGHPRVNAAWKRAAIPDDPVKESNLRGHVTFAKTGRPNSRTTQLFINLVDNKGLDRQGFSPFARVVEGMEVVDAIYAIGEGAPRGRGPSQQRITSQGNAYLKRNFPKLDYLKSARVLD